MSFFRHIRKRLYETSGLPSNLQGHNGDYALGQDGVIYKKQAGTWAAYGGGGSTGAANYGTNQSVATSTLLDWGTQYGDDLFDLTDPTQPTAKAAGVYVVTVSLQIPQTANKNAALKVDLDALVADYYAEQVASLSSAFPRLSASAGYRVPLGGVVSATIFHDVGGDLAVSPFMAIVKVS